MSVDSEGDNLVNPVISEDISQTPPVEITAVDKNLETFMTEKKAISDRQREHLKKAREIKSFKSQMIKEQNTEYLEHLKGIHNTMHGMMTRMSTMEKLVNASFENNNTIDTSGLLKKRKFENEPNVGENLKKLSSPFA